MLLWGQMEVSANHDVAASSSHPAAVPARKRAPVNEDAAERCKKVRTRDAGHSKVPTPRRSSEGDRGVLLQGHQNQLRRSYQFPATLENASDDGPLAVLSRPRAAREPQAAAAIAGFVDGFQVGNAHASGTAGHILGSSLELVPDHVYTAARRWGQHARPLLTTGHQGQHHEHREHPQSILSSSSLGLDLHPVPPGQAQAPAALCFESFEPFPAPSPSSPPLHSVAGGAPLLKPEPHQQQLSGGPAEAPFHPHHGPLQLVVPLDRRQHHQQFGQVHAHDPSLEPLSPFQTKQEPAGYSSPGPGTPMLDSLMYQEQQHFSPVASFPQPHSFSHAAIEGIGLQHIAEYPSPAPYVDSPNPPFFASFPPAVGHLPTSTGVAFTTGVYTDPILSTPAEWPPYQQPYLAVAINPHQDYRPPELDNSLEQNPDQPAPAARREHSVSFRAKKTRRRLTARPKAPTQAQNQNLQAAPPMVLKRETDGSSLSSSWVNVSPETAVNEPAESSSSATATAPVEDDAEDEEMSEADSVEPTAGPSNPRAVSAPTSEADNDSDEDAEGDDEEPEARGEPNGESEPDADGDVDLSAEGEQGAGGAKSARATQKKARSAFNDARRAQTRETRHLKACIRCNMQRVRCIPSDDDPNGECMTCRKVDKGSRKVIHKVPCMRVRIGDLTLYRTGGLNLTKRWRDGQLKDVGDWPDEPEKRIEITLGLCDEPIRLRVKRFRPRKDDVLSRYWDANGTRKSMLLAAYAIVDVHEAAADLKLYVDRNAFVAIERACIYSDALIRDTFAMAMRHFNLLKDNEEGYLTNPEKAFLANVFRLWFAIRHTVGSSWICGPEKLGMTPTKDETYPLGDRISIPRMVIAQFDSINKVALLDKLKKMVLDKLNELLRDTNPRCFFTVYIAVFILLHEVAVASADRFRHARQNHAKTRYSLPRFVEELQAGANNILAHWHYYKSTHDPFQTDWKAKNKSVLADMPADQVTFVLKSRMVIKDKEDDFRIMRENNLWEDPLYFVSFMFDKEWDACETFMT